MATVRITIEHDSDTENPLTYDGWALYTFANNHYITDVPYHRYLKGVENGTPVPANQGVANRLKSGTAFWVSRYAHSSEQWGLVGEVCQCQWDTTQIAGILVWEQKPSVLPKEYDKREESARATLRVYTDWANGETYWYMIEQLTPDDEADQDDWEAEEIDSCGGYIGADDVADAIRLSLKGHGLADADIIVTGDCGWVGDFHQFAG